MLIETKQAKRLGIFFFYDKDGVADKYNEYLLSEICKSLETLYIVINGKIDDDSLSMFESITENIIIRENIGFDVWAYKTAIDNIGWKKLESYDEMIMFNFTVFGPFYSFTDMFLDMDKRDLDFWGITKHYAIHDYPFGKRYSKDLPTHIQSHFIAVRKSMIVSKEYQDYWNGHVPINCYEDAVCFHEAIFTKLFSDYGYVWDTYIETDDMEETTVYPLMAYPQELLKRGCPIIKRKSFFMDYIQYFGFGTYGESIDKTIEYIKDNTKYNIEYIWDNILRTNSMNDIKNCCHLDYIIEPVYNKINLKNKAILFCVIINNGTQEIILKKIEKLIDSITICIMSSYDETYFSDYISSGVKFTKINPLDSIGICNNILNICNRNNFEIVGFVSNLNHEKDIQAILRGVENIADSKEHVAGIYDLFLKENRLGMLVSPELYHGKYLAGVEKEWKESFNELMVMAEKYDAVVPISKENVGIYASYDMAWYRKSVFIDVLSHIVNNKCIVKGEYIRILIALLVQKKNFYCAFGSTLTSAKRDLSNYKYLFKRYQQIISNNFDIKWVGDSLYYLSEALNNLKKYYEDINELREFSNDLDTRFKEASEYCRNLEGQIVGKNNYINDLERQIAEKNVYISTLENEMMDKVENNEEFIKMKNEFEYMKNSKSWKITKVFRKIIEITCKK